MSVEAILLGTAQDGGVPQAGCDCPRCVAAQEDAARREFVVCLGIIDHGSRQYWMVDATPDFREQIHRLRQIARDEAGAYGFGGILLTHAHMGHYTGLLHLGKEAWNTQETTVYCSMAMYDFLIRHAPWSQLVAYVNIYPEPIQPGRPVRLSKSLSVTPLLVPHRNEWSDTLAFLVEGPSAKLFYCPDIDAWDQWDRDLRGFLLDVDVALLDATFYSPADLPDRDLSEIPHPFVTDTLPLVTGLDCQVGLIHLNHTNPLYNALHPDPRTAEGAEPIALPPNVHIWPTGTQWAL